MYPYHDVLAKYSDFVEFYVVDARLRESGHTHILLTVLVCQELPHRMVLELICDLWLSMSDTALKELAADLGYPAQGRHPVLFTPQVQRISESVS